MRSAFVLRHRPVLAAVLIASAIATAVGTAGPSAADASVHESSPAASPPAATTPLTVGTRLTWQAGDASTQGARLVPDPNGWVWRDNQWYRIESSGGSGGVGLQQLDIVSDAGGQIVGDLRTYVTTDLQTGVSVPSGASVVTGDVTEIPGFWMAPERLAALTTGVDGNTRVMRGPRTFNGQTFDTVSIAHVGNGSYDSSSYDVATGLLLFGGSMSASPGVTITDEFGNLPETFAGSVRTQHALFVGSREVVVPWADAAPPSWLRPGLTLTYRGQTTMESAAQTGLPGLDGPQMEASHTIDQLVGSAALARQVLRFSNGAGLPPTESTTPRVYASAMLDGMWIPADRVATLAAGDVLDQDPATGRSITFGGVQGTTAVIVNTGPSDRVEQFYDTSSGMLVASRATVANAIGNQVTELLLVSA